MGLWNNIKTFVNVGFLAGTDATVTKVFGDYDNAASAQADVNTLAAIIDSGITVRHFSKRRPQQQLYLEDILGVEREEPKPKDKKETLIEWFNSLPPEEKEFVKNALK